MSIDNKKLAIQALHQMRGDDLYRARAAFHGKTQAEMNQQWGQSSKTCAEILAEYEAYDAKVMAAVKWVEGIEVAA